MKAFLRKNKGKLIFWGIILIIALLWFLTYERIRTINISIDRERVSYVVVNPGGAGPVRVFYAEHQKAVDDLIDVLEGDYKYVRLWRRIPSDAGGPRGILFFDSQGKLIQEIYHRNGWVMVDTASDEFYLAYWNPDKLLDTTDFYAYAEEVKRRNQPNY